MLHIPPVLATENIVFVSGAFRRTIYVSDLESFAKTGVPVGLLADLLKFSKQNPKSVQGMINTELPVPVVLTSRLLYTRIGEAILARATAVMHPLRAPQFGIQALRSALVLGVDEAHYDRFDRAFAAYFKGPPHRTGRGLSMPTTVGYPLAIAPL